VLITEAFYGVDASHIDRALNADLHAGFPDDVFGLLRVFLRTLAIMEGESSATIAQGPDRASELEGAIVDRLKVLVELEERRLGQLDEGPPSIARVTDPSY
jgi:hypothetical protein